MSTFTGQVNRDISLMRAIVYIQFSVRSCSTGDVRLYLLGIDQSGHDADNRNQGNAKGIVIVIVQGPQNYAGNLEYVERVNDLWWNIP